MTATKIAEMAALPLARLLWVSMETCSHVHGTWRLRRGAFVCPPDVAEVILSLSLPPSLSLSLSLSLSAFLHAETSSLVCANPRTGACRENGGADDDCCATAGNGGCAPGYTFAGQIHLSQTATTDLDGFYRGMDGTCYEGNTCCVPDGEINSLSCSLSLSLPSSISCLSLS